MLTVRLRNKVSLSDNTAFCLQKHRALISCVLNNDSVGAVTLLQGGAKLGCVSGETKHPLELAIVKRHLVLAYVLVTAESDVNVVRRLLKDGVVFYFTPDVNFIDMLKVGVSQMYLHEQ